MNEDFEQHLREQPLRQIPAEWRNEILSAARAAKAPTPVASTRPRSLLSTLNRQLSNIFWPHPVAWAGLAAVWIFILAVNYSGREPSPMMVKKTSPPSPEVVAQLRQQQRMYAELIGTISSAEADRRKSFAPGPRSERAGQMMMV